MEEARASDRDRGNKRPAAVALTPSRPSKVLKLMCVPSNVPGRQSSGFGHFKLRGSPKRKLYKPRQWVQNIGTFMAQLVDTHLFSCMAIKLAHILNKRLNYVTSLVISMSMFDAELITGF